VFERRKLGAVVVCVERAGELFLAQRLPFQIGVLNIAGAAVSPLNDGIKSGT